MQHVSKQINFRIKYDQGFFFEGLANIPESIVELAQTKASAFERWVTLKRILLTLKKVTDNSQEQQPDLLQFLSQLKLN